MELADPKVSKIEENPISDELKKYL